jgi:hypothetical protein
VIYKRTRSEVEALVAGLLELLEYPSESHQLVEVKGKQVVVPIDEEMAEGLGMVIVEDKEPRERLRLVG